MSAESWVYIIGGLLLAALFIGFGAWTLWDSTLAPRRCHQCSASFRGRNGGGVSGSIFCSDACYTESFIRWVAA